MEIIETVKVIRRIEYDGHNFYEDGKGYWLGSVKGADNKPHRIRLHVYVWEKFNGPVPDGYDIHHIDHDRSNNEIENLVAIPHMEHMKMHADEVDKDEARENLQKYAIPKAIEWHKSDEGRSWHKEHYEETIGKLWEETVTKTCEYCGKTYTVQKPKAASARFCSNKCKVAWRYHSGIDNVERDCVICGKKFCVNKYSRVKTCCADCARKLAVISKTAKRHQNS